MGSPKNIASPYPVRWSRDKHPGNISESFFLHSARMRGKFTIEAEPARNLIRMTLTGFFDIETIEAFSVTLYAAVARLGCAPNQHIVLCDISGCSLQSQAAVAAFQKVLSEGNRSRRVAVVSGSSLAWMQARRILDRDELACFEMEPEAMQWLLAVTPDQAVGIVPGRT